MEIHADQIDGVYKYNFSGELSPEELFTMKYLVIKLEAIR